MRSDPVNLTAPYRLGVEVTIPLRTVNPLNRREHHHARAKRVRDEKSVVTALMTRHAPVQLPVVVTLTRISPRAMDSDGAIAALKTVRDSVAAWLGVDDRDSRDLVWRYEQAKGPMGVRVEVRHCPW